MVQRPSHLVAGAAGFVGRSIVLELLTTTDADVTCLVRPAGSPDTAYARLVAALTRAAYVYGVRQASVLADIRLRCRVVQADLDGPLLAVPRELGGHVEHVWHCAASLCHRPDERPVAYRTNVGGTERLLQLAVKTGASAFHHVSTAYVAGTRDGHIPERRAVADVTQNVYEESMVDAEELALSATEFRTTVLRPSAVVGHSVTGAVSGNPAGIYRLAYHLVAHDRRTAGGIRLHLDPRSTLNIVPVDRVAREAVACGRFGADRGIFHLTAPRPVTVGTLIDSLCVALSLDPVTFVGTVDDLRPDDRQMAGRLGFYAAYLRGDRAFDPTNTDGVMAATGPARPDSGLSLDGIWQWFAKHDPSASW